LCSSVAPSLVEAGSMCDLAGGWVPTRHSEWYNRNPGKHSLRAQAPHTKVTFDADGAGTGWVGEFYVNIQVSMLAPGQYTASCRVGLWYAGDGNYTILEDGTLEIRYPSNGIIEYWQRVDGQGVQILADSKAKAQQSDQARGRADRRPITLAFRHFGADNKDYFWHWGLAVGDDVYEVAAWMAIMGPKGIVASNTAVIPYKTALRQFHGYLPLDTKTRKSDADIQSFIKEWVRTHPMYNAFGPNCQTFAEDLHTYLTGENLPFAKFADRFGQHDAAGPEGDPRTVWNNPAHKPDASKTVSKNESKACVLSRRAHCRKAWCERLLCLQ